MARPGSSKGHGPWVLLANDCLWMSKRIVARRATQGGWSLRPCPYMAVCLCGTRLANHPKKETDTVDPGGPHIMLGNPWLCCFYFLCRVASPQGNLQIQVWKITGRHSHAPAHAFFADPHLLQKSIWVRGGDTHTHPHMLFLQIPTSLKK